MEEHVGKLWHRLITDVARSGYPDAAVLLDDVAGQLGPFFRALGGDPALRIEAADAEYHGAARGWLQRIAGSARKSTYASRDERALCLPPRLDLFPERRLNRRLYYWLTAMAAYDCPGDDPWSVHSARLTLRVLRHCPGLADDYRDLVRAVLATRPHPDALPADAAALERALQAQLRHPEQAAPLPAARRPPLPVPLWLHPHPRRVAVDPAGDDDDGARSTGSRRTGSERRRRKAERVRAPQQDRGLLAMRWESIFGHGEHVNVDRGSEEEDDLQRAAEVADDMDHLSVARDRQTCAAAIRFDLDLPAADQDDLPLGPGIHLPEWDWRQGRLQADYCCLQPMLADRAQPAPLPPRLRADARRLRRQYQALATTPRWQRAQTDGPELDLEAYQRFLVERRTGPVDGEPRVYSRPAPQNRDLACLVLADLSLSTDAWINNDSRVIDVIRDSLLLFGEALSGSRDRFALYGFSSRHRHHVRFHQLKRFDEAFSDRVRGRVLAARPGYYTRMGAAVRHASDLLLRQNAERRLLLLVSDGKPNDLDRYEGRYGLEDTRHSLVEARNRGLTTFCVTVDDQAGDYLPHLFGSNGYCVIHRPEQLPNQLPRLYAQLTGTRA